jgi:glycosyltransferase involved in cell wall biosynthesis
MKVSVIIPVYNAAQFVEQAVLSALNQPQTGEILLIEDASKDSSLEVCKKLELKFDKVNLLQHPNAENKGAAESRNLGIKMSKYDYISFLDADDMYNDNRFNEAEKLLTNNDKIDGVYDCAQYLGESKLFTIRKPVHPKKLFHYLLRGTYGHFHTNAITLKKTVFDTVGFFHPDLKLHQDTEMWLRLAHSCKLINGNLTEPVCFIRRHPGNRIWVGFSNETRYKAYYAFYQWLKGKDISVINKLFLIRKLAKLQGAIKNTFWLKEFFKILFLI